MRYIFLIISLIGLSFNSTAIDFAVSNIPDSLLKDSRAVIRDFSIDLNVRSATSATQTVNYALTIMNREWADEGGFSCMVSDFESLKNFSGTIYDANGKVIKKLKKSDLRYSEYSDHLASDNATYYLMPQFPFFPLTIEYNYEVEQKKFVPSYSPFFPYFGKDIPIQKYSYNMVVPAGFEILFKALNTNLGFAKSETAKGIEYNLTVSNIKGVKEETFMPPINNIIPKIYISPKMFAYNNIMVNMSNWAQCGDWINYLGLDRQTIPTLLSGEIHSMTDHLTSDYDKIKVLYDYLGKNYRYVSIQLGIGGLQPASIESTYKNKFGDCKALSFLMQNMLKECGIKSNYVLINTNNPQITKDFASFAMANHAIVSVPMENDTLWIECTNTDYPLGYNHEGIAGHDCVPISHNNSKVVTIPSYNDSLNLDIQTINVTLNEDGTANATLKQVCKVREYENMAFIEFMKNDKRQEFFRKRIDVYDLDIDSLSYSFKKDKLPELTINEKITIHKYGNKTNVRWFVPINPFRYHGLNLDSKRTHDIYIDHGYSDIDSLTITFPEDMKIESLPAPTLYVSKFGSVSLICNIEGNKISVNQKFVLNSGTYPKEDFEELKKLFSTAKRLYSAKVILKK